MSEDKYIVDNKTIQSIAQQPHIYKITNLINQKYYYGVHRGHNTANYMGSGELLKKAYEKYGMENFKKEILLWFDTVEEAYEYEAVIVNEKMIHKNNPMCYNICKGGSGGDRYTCQSPERQAEISKKLSQSVKAAKLNSTWTGHSEETKKRISQKTAENYANLPEAVKKEYSEKRKETYKNMSEEQKLAAVQKRKETYDNMTEEQKLIIRQRQSDSGRGRPKPDEWKKKMSEFWKGKTNNAELNNVMYQCPYDDRITNAGCMSQYIKRYYPDEKQWQQFTKEEKQSFKIN